MLSQNRWVPPQTSTGLPGNLFCFKYIAPPIAASVWTPSLPGSAFLLGLLDWRLHFPTPGVTKEESTYRGMGSVDAWAQEWESMSWGLHLGLGAQVPRSREYTLGCMRTHICLTIPMLTQGFSFLESKSVLLPFWSLSSSDGSPSAYLHPASSCTPF